ncbi:hypothetical protein BC332_18989 [Capsicum chinense]|nr:hypothetical protein BC332_18989 [Capsicum chinense]
MIESNKGKDIIGCFSTFAIGSTSALPTEQHNTTIGTTGGNGKTFLYRALLATIRSKGLIALATVTSGVAASILPGGRTAHSRFKISINIDEQFSCNISKQSSLAFLIRDAKLIVWDEVVVMRMTLHCQGCAGKVKKSLSKLEVMLGRSKQANTCRHAAAPQADTRVRFHSVPTEANGPITPATYSYVAFINAIKVVSPPDEFIPDQAAAASPPTPFNGLSE